MRSNLLTGHTAENGRAWLISSMINVHERCSLDKVCLFAPLALSP